MALGGIWEIIFACPLGRAAHPGRLGGRRVGGHGPTRAEPGLREAALAWLKARQVWPRRAGGTHGRVSELPDASAHPDLPRAERSRTKRASRSAKERRRRHREKGARAEPLRPTVACFHLDLQQDVVLWVWAEFAQHLRVGLPAHRGHADASPEASHTSRVVALSRPGRLSAIITEEMPLKAKFVLHDREATTPPHSTPSSGPLARGSSAPLFRRPE